MAFSKVTLNGATLMDVTQDTVNENNLLSGETATGADGEQVIGKYHEWEFIADTTTTEDLTTVTVNTDISGQPFSLSRMFARVSLPQATTGTRDYVRGDIIYTKKNGVIADGSCPTLRYVTDTNLTAFFEYDCEIICDFYRVLVRNGTSYNNSQYASALSFPNIRANSDNIPIAINGIKLYQYNTSSTLIPAGTRIAIYGFRI